MTYREFLVMRKGLAWYAAVLFAIALVVCLGKAMSVSTGDHDALRGVVTASAFPAAIFASIFGVALGNASREAARVLWTLPMPRWILAVQLIAVDLAGATIAFACTCAIILGSYMLAGLRLNAAMFSSLSPELVVMAIAMVWACYGWSAALGMLGRRMAYCGILALPALMSWLILAQSPASGLWPLRAPVAANPFAVFVAGTALQAWQRHHFALGPLIASLQWLGTIWATPVLLAVCIGTCAIAVLLWQRAEVIT